MKTMRYISGLFLTGMFLAFASCDKIKDNERLVDQGIVKIESERCVLLEDYSGVRCVNCPNAAEEIKDLQAAYGKNLVVVGLSPKGTTLTEPYGSDPDLRTEEARSYADHFKIVDLPKGMVNRKEVLDYTAWGGAVQNVFDDTAADYVNLAATARLSGTNMQVAINGDFKKDYPGNGDINVIAMIVEDNINARQLLPGNKIDKEYVHNHILRAVISDDIWGDKVSDAHPVQGVGFSKEYTAVLDGAWKTENISLVVAVVDASSREVLQAASAHLK